jgi:hypothetical protein
LGPASQACTQLLLSLHCCLCCKLITLVHLNLFLETQMKVKPLQLFTLLYYYCLFDTFWSACIWSDELTKTSKIKEIIIGSFFFF